GHARRPGAAADTRRGDVVTGTQHREADARLRLRGIGSLRAEQRDDAREPHLPGGADPATPWRAPPPDSPGPARAALGREPGLQDTHALLPGGELSVQPGHARSGRLVSVALQRGVRERRAENRRRTARRLVR